MSFFQGWLNNFVTDCSLRATMSRRLMFYPMRMIKSTFFLQKLVNAPVISMHHGTAIDRTSTAVEQEDILPIQAESKAFLANFS